MTHIPTYNRNINQYLKLYINLTKHQIKQLATRVTIEGTYPRLTVHEVKWKDIHGWVCQTSNIIRER